MTVDDWEALWTEEVGGRGTAGGGSSGREKFWEEEREWSGYEMLSFFIVGFVISDIDIYPLSRCKAMCSDSLMYEASNLRREVTCWRTEQAENKHKKKILTLKEEEGTNLGRGKR